MKPQILIACYPHSVLREGDVLGCAMTEDGEVLAEHLSSNEGFSKHDMGFIGDWQHAKYRERFPDGFELIWIGLDYKTDERWQAALARNRIRVPVEAENEAVR